MPVLRSLSLRVVIAPVPGPNPFDETLLGERVAARPGGMPDALPYSTSLNGRPPAAAIISAGKSGLGAFHLLS